MTPDVLIVGAGPVGLTMAIELVRYGVPVRIIDKAAARTDKSKALVIWSRTLELLERSGCSARLVDAGYKVTSVRVSADGKAIAQLTLDSLETKYPYGLMIPQSETERVLEEFLRGLGVTVERNVELLSFRQSQHGVVSILRRADGSEETVATNWLIGCDGAHSSVRHQLGMAFHGATLLIDWILADVHLENFPRKPEMQIVWHPSGILALFPISEDRYRAIADVGVAQDATARRPDPTLAEVQAVLDERFQGVRATNPVWLSSFRINERKVADYRSGRAFLAGDAAHVHSPAGGQGMNTGMQDACNLAWKLALVSRGLGAEGLLSSYSAERSPIAEQVLKVTGRATSMVTWTSEVAQFFRNHTAALVLGLSPVRKFAAKLVSEISIGYSHSPLNAPHGEGDPPPGTRAPIRANEAPVGAGDTPRFALCAEAADIPADLLQTYHHVLEPQPRPPYEPGGIWLVRPDGYVAFSSRKANWSALHGYLGGISAVG